MTGFISSPYFLGGAGGGTDAILAEDTSVLQDESSGALLVE